MNWWSKCFAAGVIAAVQINVVDCIGAELQERVESSSPPTARHRVLRPRVQPRSVTRTGWTWIRAYPASLRPAPIVPLACESVLIYRSPACPPPPGLVLALLVGLAVLNWLSGK
jgi:hypothetical protein